MLTVVKEIPVPAAFPDERPEIEVAPLDEAPFEVECRELLCGFIAPEPGERRQWANYDYPDWRFTEMRDLEVIGRGKVHGQECAEIRCLDYDAGRQLTRLSCCYGGIQDGEAKYFGWWNLGDDNKLWTWKDEDFLSDWAPNPIRLRDAGLFRWGDDRHAVKDLTPWDDPKVYPVGAGVCRLRIGEREYRTLRWIDVDPRDERGTMIEGFVTPEGRMLMGRRYNAPRYALYAWNGKEARELFRDAPTLVCNETTYYLWYDFIAADALGLEG
jgi:hypothetical protein